MNDDYLKNMLKRSEENAERLDDDGHLALVKDISTLTFDVERDLYHDYHANGHATPKIALSKALNDLSNAVKQGKYDN